MLNPEPTWPTDAKTALTVSIRVSQQHVEPSISDFANHASSQVGRLVSLPLSTLNLVPSTLNPETRNPGIPEYDKCHFTSESGKGLPVVNSFCKEEVFQRQSRSQWLSKTDQPLSALWRATRTKCALRFLGRLRLEGSEPEKLSFSQQAFVVQNPLPSQSILFGLTRKLNTSARIKLELVADVLKEKQVLMRGSI